MDKVKILPLLPVRDAVIFPYMVIPLSVGRPKSIAAVEEGMSGDKLIFLATQKKIEIDEPQEEDLYKIGVVGEVLQILRTPEGTIRILVEGLQRGRITNFDFSAKFIKVNVETIQESEIETPEIKALMRNTLDLFEEYIKLNKKLSLEIIPSLENISQPGKLADIVSAYLHLKIPQKQAILEELNVYNRLELICRILTEEIDILRLENKIKGRIKSQIEKSQKEYYLGEQMKAIQKELRKKDEAIQEIEELRKKIKEAKMTPEANKVAEKEISRLEKMVPFSPEAGVIRSYLEWLISLPWAKKTEDNLDIKKAEKILRKEHFGLEKAKERVIEYLAVCKLTKKIKGPILCFVGPPGTGKSSFAHSIAHALSRNFIRVSLGGIRDEAEIRGHRRTYIGALPGRIIQGIAKAGSKNPVFLLDEIDKIGLDFRGDPSAALLEVLDPQQNFAFSDHYLEVGFDLSDVMFITTANTLYSIPPSLLDRMEVIEFPGYTQSEKVKIANNFLIPKQKKENGIASVKINIDEDTILKVIEDYTREAGVRNLDREIANILRKIAKEIAVDKKLNEKIIDINSKNLQKYLGIPKFIRETEIENEIGVSTGLAWTEHGGEILFIETTVMQGKEKLTLTGKLGEVMQESAKAALSYIRSNATKFNLSKDFFKNQEIHIHVPEGAVPKDGPSAGVAIITALLSVLTGIKVRKDIAMTGEITLRGKVLPVGGIKEKLLAAYQNKLKEVIIPQKNVPNLEEISEEVKRNLKIIPVKTVEEVFVVALEKNPFKEKEIYSQYATRIGIS